MKLTNHATPGRNQFFYYVDELDEIHLKIEQENCGIGEVLPKMRASIINYLAGR